MAGDSYINPASPTRAGDELVRSGDDARLSGRRDDDGDDLVGGEVGLGRDLLDAGQERQVLGRGELDGGAHGDGVIAHEVGEDDGAVAVLEAQAADDALALVLLGEGTLVVEGLRLRAGRLA